MLTACGGSDDSSSDEIIPEIPSIIVDKTSISFDDTMVSKSSSTISVLVESKNVTSALKIDCPEGFEISFDNLNFENSLTIEANQSKTVHVRFSPIKIQSYTGSINIQNDQAQDVKINLSGDGVQLKFNYKTFSKKRLAWGSGYSQAASQNFDLHSDNSNIEAIKMYIRLECPAGGCDPWDRFANILVKNQNNNQLYEIARHITPYGVGNSQLSRGLEVDVTDFKSILTGNVELKIYAETWVASGWVISLEFDYLSGTPDYKYYQVTPVIQFNRNSLADSDGRACAEWCYRTHKIKINNVNKFSHYMGPIGCGSNPISNQAGNWVPDRAGWCPGMVVPVRIDKFDSDVSNSTLNFEYYFHPWTNNFVGTPGYNNKNAYNAISSFIVLKSDQQIEPASISN